MVITVTPQLIQLQAKEAADVEDGEDRQTIMLITVKKEQVVM